MGESTETAGQRFAARMRQERERRGWRQEDLAVWAAAEGLSLHATAFSKIESGQRKVTLDEAAAIAGAFGVSLSQLLTSTDPGQIARELEQARADFAEAQAASDAELHRAAALWNQIQELVAVLGQERGGYPPAGGT